MNMLFQRSIKKQSRDVHPNAVGYVPREEPHTADHALEETLQEREMR